jgi:hypothetical protein
LLPLLVLVSILCTISVSTQKVEVSIAYDDFEVWSNLWIPWEQRTGKIATDRGVCRIGITNESSGEHDSIAAIHDYYEYNWDLSMPWLYEGIEVRLRCSDDNKLQSGLGGGTRCWGFVDFTPFDLPPINGLAFWSGSPECDGYLNGFSATSIVNSNVYNQSIIDVDISEWHTYTILWGADNATFLIDGNIVATTEEVPERRMGTIILISNIVASEDIWAVDLDVDEWVEIDYVHVFQHFEKEEISSEIGELLEHVSTNLDVAADGGVDIAEISGEFENAKRMWENNRLNQARDILEDISPKADNLGLLGEIMGNNWFEEANNTILKTEQEGRTRDALIMKGKLKSAQICWEDEDYACVKRYLEQIHPIPETLLVSILLILSLLGSGRSCPNAG